MLSSFLTHC